MNSGCIAIDGPVASGKTVIGKLIANQLGYRFLDTGVMYRAVALAAMRQNIDPEDELKVSELARSLDMRLVACESGDRLLVDGEDVTDHLRNPEVEHSVSYVSRISDVRSTMVEHQRSIAKAGAVVMVGRDIGTVVMPHADFKIYLKASVEVRAQRRHQEVVKRGGDSSLANVLAELTRRDKLDSERADSPLKPADDAVQINTDNLNVEDVANKILSLVESL